jgi:K+-transporting ATPase ATPase C chain
MLKMIRTVFMSLMVFTILTGMIYPLAVTGLAQLLFPAQANGSIIQKNGRSVGSALIGQPFDDPKYFWGRLSSTAPFPYNSAASSGSNLAQSNPALVERAKARMAALQKADPQAPALVPADLATASGSGLDPQISPAAAEYQMRRVAASRGLEESVVRTLIEANIEDRQLGVLGEPRVSVLKLNLALDEIIQKREVD